MVMLTGTCRPCRLQQTLANLSRTSLPWFLAREGRGAPLLFRKMSLFKRCCLCKMTFWGYPEPPFIRAPLCFQRCEKVCPWEDGAIWLETLCKTLRELSFVNPKAISIIISNWFALPLEKRLRWPTFGRAKDRFSKDCARFRSWFSEARYPL